MAKPATRIAFVQLMIGAAALGIVGKSAQLQLGQRQKWLDQAERERTRVQTLPARRGSILDRTGVLLAQTRESYHFGISTNQIDDPKALSRLVTQSLKRPKQTAAALERELRTLKYKYFYGPFSPIEMEQIRKQKGVDLRTEYQRVYPAPNLALGTIGNVSDSHGISGIEKALDSLLTGVPGEQVMLKDHYGRQFESPRRAVRDPIPGNDVLLTIDAGLQEIAEHALDDAIARLQARGGDVVFLDPHTGEILAIASRQADGTVSATALVSPLEPGSTAKLFTAAALLRLKKVSSSDAVDGEGGEWIMEIPGKRPVKRRIRDAHAEHGPLTLARAIEVSSNIAMAKFSERLTNAELYEVIRDFGFGSKTGVEFSAEDPGRLRPLRDWDGLSRASIATGYEFEVTAVQLAAAYGAIANDGRLMTPTLVREVRGPDGTVMYRHRPEPVRQVVSPDVAATLREYLRGAVSVGGTGDQAQLENFLLIGKTGTAHQMEHGRYVNLYTSSFAAIFPADHPQLIAIVIIDAPKVGSYYGGQTAAPLTKRMLEEALAARESAINRNQLAEQDTAAVAAVTPAAPRPPVAQAAPLPTVRVAWPYRPKASAVAAGPVPDVSGLNVRAAATALHRRGFHVVLNGLQPVSRTEPPAGETAAYGSTVTVISQH